MSRTAPIADQPTAWRAQTWISATLVLIAATLLSKLLGFVRDLLVARYFGATAAVDAFMVAVTAPTLLGSAGFALSTAFIPRYRSVLAHGDALRARELAGGALGLVALTSLLAAAAIALLAPQLMNIIAPGLAPETRALAVALMRRLALLTLGLNLVYMLGAIYNAGEHFTIPAFTDLLTHAWMLGAIILLARHMGIYSLAVGLVGGTLFVAGVLTVHLVRSQTATLSMQLWNGELRDLAWFAAPVLLIEIASQGGALIENFFGAGLEAGSISALGFAKRMTVAGNSLLAINIARAVFPALSRLVSENNLDGARDLLEKLSRQYAVMFIPLSIFLVFFRDDIVHVLFFRGAFDAAAATKTATAFGYYAAGLAVLAFVPLFLRVCYAFSDTRGPLAATLITLAGTAALSAAFVPHLGLGGIALASTLAPLPAVGFMVIRVRRSLGSFDLGGLLKATVLAALCAAGALGAVVGVQLALGVQEQHGIRTLLLGALAYGLSYLLIGQLLLRADLRRLWTQLGRGA